MSKSKKIYSCQECKYTSPKWVGRCPECENWNTFLERDVERPSGRKVLCENIENEPLPVEKISINYKDRIKVGIAEFDRVVGGGLVRGSLVLIGGEPGVGKSTLLGEVLGRLSSSIKEKILYVSGEESKNQVADRMRRLGYTKDNLLIQNENRWENVLLSILKLKPQVIVLDSIQTIHSTEIQSTPGSSSQVREVTYELMNHIKANDITCFVVGHITKDGSIAGPKILEHMVDTVIYFEGEKNGQYRLLRSIKNRFGNTNEIGVFEMTSKGLVEVRNPTQYFIEEKETKSFGRSLCCVYEGSRSLLIETQALVVENKYGNGRRTTQGLDSNRLSMLIAVVEKYLGEQLSYSDIYLNIVGGVKLYGREADLSIVVSLLSSANKKMIPSKSVFIGEIGLSGEVRSTQSIEENIKELSQLGYEKVITSLRSKSEFEGKYPIELMGIQNVSELKDFFL
ncbi:MAG: DNA repair protein RadA [Bacteriovoracaceae bacterium]|nr:DNA repair protein RadA [Bacteriovoracaceae bacterium]